MAESQRPNCPIHGTPECFKPALDPIIAKSYQGYCTKIDWPFDRIIPKGWSLGATYVYECLNGHRFSPPPPSNCPIDGTRVILKIG